MTQLCSKCVCAWNACMSYMRIYAFVCKQSKVHIRNDYHAHTDTNIYIYIYIYIYTHTHSSCLHTPRATYHGLIHARGIHTPPSGDINCPEHSTRPSASRPSTPRVSVQWKNVSLKSATPMTPKMVVMMKRNVMAYMMGFDDPTSADTIVFIPSFLSCVLC